MNAKTVFAGYVLALACVPGSAVAQAENTGIYSFADVGRADVERDVGAVDRINGDDTRFTLGAGYAFTPNVAVQVSYTDFGDFSATVGCPQNVLCVTDTEVSIVPFSTDRVKIDGFAVEVVGTYPLRSYPLGVFAKLGVMAWDSDWDNNRNLDESANNLIYGVGLNWAPMDRWGVKIAYDEVNMDVRSLNVGAQMRF